MPGGWFLGSVEPKPAAGTARKSAVGGRVIGVPFPAPLDLRHMPGSFYLTLAPFPYKGARDEWTVPARFHTDLTSVPRPFRWLVDVGGDHAPAAVLHDYLTRPATVCVTCKKQLHEHAHPELTVWTSAMRPPVNRSDADGVFRRVLHELGVSAPRRWLMWAGVRVGCRMKAATGQDWYYVFLLTAPATLFLLVPLLVVLPFGVLFRLVERMWP